MQCKLWAAYLHYRLSLLYILDVVPAIKSSKYPLAVHCHSYGVYLSDACCFSAREHCIILTFKQLDLLVHDKLIDLCQVLQSRRASWWGLRRSLCPLLLLLCGSCCNERWLQHESRWTRLLTGHDAWDRSVSVTASGKRSLENLTYDHVIRPGRWGWKCMHARLARYTSAYYTTTTTINVGRMLYKCTSSFLCNWFYIAKKQK